MAVGTIYNDANQEVVLVECPLGHPGGKGEVVPAYLGKAECGQQTKAGKTNKDGTVAVAEERCKAILVPQKDPEAKAEGKKGSRNVSIDAEETLNQPGVPSHSARGTDLRAGTGRTGADVIREAQKPRGKQAEKAAARGKKAGKTSGGAKSTKKAAAPAKTGKAAKKGR